MSNSSTYRVALLPEADGGFSVVVPALPGCYTQGDSREEAIAMAKEAIQLHLESLLDQGEELPVDAAEIATVDVVVPAA